MISRLTPAANALLESQLQRVEIINNQPAVDIPNELDTTTPVEKPTYVQPTIHGRTMRAYIGAAQTLLKPNRFQRWSTWWFMVPLKIKTFVVAITGGKVSTIETAERWKECSNCSLHEITLHQNRHGRVMKKHYCKQCGCGRWKFSELKFKNKLKKWYCPRRKHKNEYPGDWAKKYMDKNTNGDPRQTMGCNNGG